MVYESKAHYADKAKRESMTFCQQMIRFFQQQLKERIAIIEERKQIINQYEQKLEEHTHSISFAKGRALVAERDLAMMHKELEQQQEKTTIAMHEAQISQDAIEQLYKNYHDLKMNEESRNIQKNDEFLKQQVQIEFLELSLAKMMSEKEVSDVSYQEAKKIIEANIEKIRAQEEIIAQLKAKATIMQQMPKLVPQA